MKNVPILGMISDTHLKAKNLSQIKDIFLQFIQLLLDNEIKLAIHLGDWFHERSSQHIDNLVEMGKIIKLFELNDIYLFGIQGNHDKVYQDGLLGYVSIYHHKQIKHFVLFPNYNFYDLERNKIRLHFIPYFVDNFNIELLKSRKNIKKGFKNVLFTHTSFNGAKNNDGSLVEDGINKEYVSHFDKVFSGHYHERNKISEKIEYIGSAYQASYGENEHKGFTLLYPDLTTTFHQSQFKKYKQLQVQATDRKAIKEITDQLRTIDKEQYNIRVKLLGSQQDLESVDISTFNALGAEVKKENIVEANVDFDAAEQVGSVVFTKGELMKQYIKYTQDFAFTSAQRAEGLKWLKQV